MHPTLELDETVDAAYVYLRPDGTPVDHTEEVSDRRLADYDALGDALGIEFLDVRNGVDLSELPTQLSILRGTLAELFESKHIPVYT